MKTGYDNIDANVNGFGSLNIFYNAGGKVESKGYRGISHLAEHLISKCIEPIEEQLDAYGISQNAVTSENFVLFYFNGLNENLKKLEEKILSILHYSPTEAEFEQEKKIVLREYDDTFSEKRSLILNILRKYFNAYSAIGYKEDIKNITYEDYLNFQKEHFKNPLYILRVGDTELSHIYHCMNYTQETKKEYTLSEQNDYEPECNTSSKNVYYVDWVNLDMNHRDLTMIEYYLGYGLMSPLYQELREKLGYVYYVQADSMKLGSGRLFSIMYESEAKNEKVLKKVIKKLISSLPYNLSETRFENVKKTIESIIIKQNILNHSTEYARTASDDNFYSEKWFEEMTFDKFKELFKNFSEKFEQVKHSKLGRNIKV